MSLIYGYLNEGQGIVYRASGQLTGSEIIAALTNVNSPALAERPVLYAFFDCDDITGMDISIAQLRNAADLGIRGHRYQSATRVVAIYAKNDLPFALAQIWQVFVQQTGWETEIFREKSKAVAWLRERVAARFGMQIALEVDELEARRPA
ncbi:MAG TPA: hypothetical protein VEI03_23320 [Stellaceae bacterium]|nr:hypothetical protein [Stellaceae bacterium]